MVVDHGTFGNLAWLGQIYAKNRENHMKVVGPHFSESLRAKGPFDWKKKSAVSEGNCKKVKASKNELKYSWKENAMNLHEL